METTPLPEICPHCQALVSNEAFFCPNCGKALKEEPISVSLGKQLAVYAISFFLVPFGLIWAVKYIQSSNGEAKKVGYVCLALTVFSSIITLYLAVQTIGVMSGFISTLQ